MEVSELCLFLPIAYFHHRNLVQLNLYFKIGQQVQKLLVDSVRLDKITA